MTRAKPNGKKIHIPCESIDAQIPDWLQGIALDPALLPGIRQTYQEQLGRVSEVDRDAKIAALNRRLSQLREEEVNLVRLLIAGKMSEQAFDRLRAEGQEKMRNVEAILVDLERDTAKHLDELDTALTLLAKTHDLYGRLHGKQRTTLLQILTKRIIVNLDGEMIDYELHSPFKYLRTLVDDPRDPDPSGRGSLHVRFREPNRTHPELPQEQFGMFRFSGSTRRNNGSHCK